MTLQLAAIQTSQAAIGLGAQSGLGTRPQEFRFDTMLGPISRGLSLASGLFEAGGLFTQAADLRGSAGQLRLQARQALEQGFQASFDIKREGQQRLGEMTAAFGKSGTLLEGSPLLVLADTTRQIERNVLRTIEQARIRQQELLYAARQREKEARRSKLGAIGKIAAVIAAPFTGGASLAALAAYEASQ